MARTTHSLRLWLAALATAGCAGVLDDKALDPTPPGVLDGGRPAQPSQTPPDGGASADGSLIVERDGGLPEPVDAGVAIQEDAGEILGPPPPPPADVCAVPGEMIRNPFASGAALSPLLITGSLRGSEGPIWLAGALYFSDLDREHENWAEPTSSRIMRWSGSGEPVEWLAASGSNGLAIGPAGTILAATHDQQAISRFALDGTRTRVMGEYEGAPFNSPNDLEIRSDGNLYFTDPDWQRGGRTSGQSATRVYRMSPAREVSVIDYGAYQPNGIVLSRGERELYVSSLAPGSGFSGQPQVTRFALDESGSASAPTTFLDDGDLEGTWPDGMAIDCFDNLYVATSVGVEVFDSQGTRLGIIWLEGGSVSNVAFGRENGRALFVTAGTRLWQVSMPIPGPRR